MKISIVTISFNQREYLQECIESILSQTECELEYIVVDPGSSDGSRALIESYGDKIIKVFAQDQGPADGLNQGFKRATGEIYGFINSDDYLLPGALKRIHAHFCAHGLNGFVTGRGYAKEVSGEFRKILPRRLTKETMLHRADIVFQPATFFPANAFKKANGFNVANKTCWDYELFLHFLLYGLRHEVLPVEVAVFRLHDGSISGSGRMTERYLRDLDAIFFQVCGRRRGLVDKLNTQFLRIKREVLSRWEPT